MSVPRPQAASEKALAKRISAEPGVDRVSADGPRHSEDGYRKLSETLAEINRRKDQFLAILSHELRNPLAPILTALHVMRTGQTDNPLHVEAREIIERQVRQMVRLVDDLLEMSRLATGKVTLRTEACELQLIVNRAIEAARPIIDKGRHTLTNDLADEPILLEADPARLQQVILNLLNNAAKYTPEGGRIQVQLRREADEVVLRVSDSGMGIAPDVLPRIFDLYAQAERSLGRSQGGLGIGLTVVRSLVELHGGSVAAHSDGAGKGSEFVVRLPLRAPEVSAQPIAATAPARASASLRLLVVDDNLDAAQSLALLLAQWGHETQLAHTGPAALHAAGDWKPQVVLLDIGLPGMDVIK